MGNSEDGRPGSRRHHRDIKYTQSSARSDRNVDTRKKRLVRQCLQRVQEQRDWLLQRARSARQVGNASLVQHDLGTIVRSAVNNSQDSANISEDEYIELMQRMEQELYDGINEGHHELDYLSALETQEIQDMMQTHFPESQQEKNARDILCPICRSVLLNEWNGVITCPTGDLHIDVSYEGITLTGLEERLNLVHQKHSASGCPEGGLNFRQQGPDDPTLHSLIASCPGCHLWEVVL